MRYIYLHGFASGPTSSKARYFADRFAEEGLDLEIPALVEDPFEEITLSAQLGVIERLLNGEEAIVLGSSMGGYLAALYAARHGEVRAGVLLAPAFGLAQRWMESLPQQKLEHWRSGGSLPFFHHVHQREMPVSYGLIEDGLQFEEEPDTRQPVLIYHGLRDDVVPSQLSVSYAAARPNVELHLVDSGHQLTDMVEPMWRRIREFIHEAVTASAPEGEVAE